MYARRVEPRYTPLAQLSSASQEVKESDPLLSQQQSSSTSTLRSRTQGDIVQFASLSFYAQEEDQKAILTVLRLGRLSGACSVRYRTKDHSAKAGFKYIATKGQLQFGPGEHVQHIEVPLISDDHFDTTIEFEVLLEQPEECQICSEFRSCRVLILDDDVFPDERFREVIEEGDESAMEKVGMSLLRSFQYFCFNHIPTIRWKSIVMIALAQLGNIYYYMMIKLKVYLVDTCLNTKAADEERTMNNLLIKGSRGQTAILLGALTVLPNVILTASDWIEMAQLEMGFNIRRHLRVNLFRKYLNYTAESRKEVPIQDLKAGMMEDIPDLVANGYIIMFEVMRSSTKIGVVAMFMLQKTPTAAGPLLIYLMVTFGWVTWRYEQRLRLLSEQGAGESETTGWLLHADHAARLIDDYRQRSRVVSMFEGVLNSQHKLTMKFKHFNFLNSRVIPWVTIIAVGVVMAYFAQKVLDHSMSLGAYLAMINVYKDLGDRFEGLYGCFEALSEAVSPLVGLTTFLNLSTDSHRRKNVNEARYEYMESYVAAHPNPNGMFSAYDNIPLSLQQVSVDYSPSLKQSVSIDTPQGNVVMIRGSHDTGKSTIVNLLTDNVENHRGFVRIPLHLRVLHVSYTPMLVNKIGLFENLSFAADRGVASDIDRIKRILHRVGLDKAWLLEELEASVAVAATAAATPRKSTSAMAAISSLKADSRSVSNKNEDSADDSDSNGDESDKDEAGDDGGKDDAWIARLSNSEKKRLHLARAFIYNPEVLVMHRPVDELDMGLSDQLLDLMREFVDNRGVELQQDFDNHRRPRTLFFTQGTLKNTTIADIVWQVGKGAGIVVERGPHSKSLGI